jgi:hypothetical protein
MCLDTFLNFEEEMIRANSDSELRMISRTVISPRNCKKRNRRLGIKKSREECSSFGRTSSAPISCMIEPKNDEYYEPANRCPDSEIHAATWNIAAPNNNPFEFWSTHETKDYDDLMSEVQKCLDCPDGLDVSLEEVFTPSMYDELRSELCLQGIENLEVLDLLWNSDLKKRKAISAFLKDRSFGEKRLISMPDRMTASIKTESGIQVFRPSPITGIMDDMSDIPGWWALWKNYMFNTIICVRGNPMPNVFSLLHKIPRAKYPALTEFEEAISRALQTLCLALFDAVFTYLLSKVAPETWQPLKRSLHKALFENKASACVSILQAQYGAADVIFVQEASESFAARAGVCLNHHVLRPSGVDGRRSQMSLILVSRGMFDPSSAADVTDDVLRTLEPKCADHGDLCAFTIRAHRRQFLLVSFHGDSDGLSTAPVLNALDRIAKQRYPGHTLIFGLDSNMPPGRGDLAPLLSGTGLSSCWEGHDLGGLWTTFNARTHLQPQLHKAVGLAGVLDRRHMRLKDWILFYRAQLAPWSVKRDNTGDGRLVAQAMPSLGFPSDHAIVACALRAARGASPALRRSPE